MRETILSKIRSINNRIDPFRYYGLRLLRVFVFYHAFIIAAEMSVMNLPFGDSSYVSEYNPFRHHFAGTFSLYVVFIMVAGIFILYDSTARRRFCKNPPEETHYFSEHIGFCVLMNSCVTLFPSSYCLLFSKRQPSIIL